MQAEATIKRLKQERMVTTQEREMLKRDLVKFSFRFLFFKRIWSLHF